MNSIQIEPRDVTYRNYQFVRAIDTETRDILTIVLKYGIWNLFRADGSTIVFNSRKVEPVRFMLEDWCEVDPEHRFIYLTGKDYTKQLVERESYLLFQQSLPHKPHDTDVEDKVESTNFLCRLGNFLNKIFYKGNRQ